MPLSRGELRAPARVFPRALSSGDSVNMYKQIRSGAEQNLFSYRDIKEMRLYFYRSGRTLVLLRGRPVSRGAEGSCTQRALCFGTPASRRPIA